MKLAIAAAVAAVATPAFANPGPEVEIRHAVGRPGSVEPSGPFSRPVHVGA